MFEQIILVLSWLLWPVLAGYVLLAAAWHVLGSASRLQGSPGKHAFGLQVGDLRGLGLLIGAQPLDRDERRGDVLFSARHGPMSRVHVLDGCGQHGRPVERKVDRHVVPLHPPPPSPRAGRSFAAARVRRLSPSAR